MLPCMQVVGLGSAGAPERATIHAPLAALPVAFPRERFLQVGLCFGVYGCVWRWHKKWQGGGGVAGERDPMHGLWGSRNG